MPFYSGGETPPRLVSCAPPTPFGRSLIHCYTVKPAALHAFLPIGGRMAF